MSDQARRTEVVGIAAVARNRVIGADNDIPWRIPADWARFKRLTLGQVLIMGRKTYESIGRPLPGRTTVVVTRDPSWRAEEVTTASDLDSAFDQAYRLADELAAEQIVVAGGGQIYLAAWDRLDRLEVTEVDVEPAGDVLFPAIGPEWQETAHEQRDGYAFITFRRRAR